MNSLEELMSYFHQDFDLEGRSVSSVIQYQIEKVGDELARQRIWNEFVQLVSTSADENDLISKMVALGAENIATSTPRAELLTFIAEANLP